MLHVLLLCFRGLGLGGLGRFRANGGGEKIGAGPLACLGGVFAATGAAALVRTGTGVHAVDAVLPPVAGVDVHRLAARAPLETTAQQAALPVLRDH